MDAALELQAGEDPLPLDLGRGALDAAQLVLVVVEHGEAPAAAFGILLVGAEQLAGEDAGLVAARGGADFQDGVLLVGHVLGEQHEADLALQRGELLLGVLQFRLGQLAHLGSESKVSASARAASRAL
jgi:hypothetical protein